MITYRKLGRMGRFAAQLQQYSQTRLYAELNKFSFALPAWIGCEVFKDVQPYNFPESAIARFLPTRQLDDIRSYNKIDRIKHILGLTKNLPDLISLKQLYENPKDNLNLYGYFNDSFALKLLARHKARIRSWFIWHDHIREIFESATKQYRPWTAVHIRRGDFVRLGLDLPVQQYLATLEQLPPNNIIVCSDDSKIQDEFKHHYPNRLISPVFPPTPGIPNYILDFWLLQNAQTVIGGGSSFSWWAAYLGRGDYYAPPLTHLWQKGGQPQITKQVV